MIMMRLSMKLFQSCGWVLAMSLLLVACSKQSLPVVEEKRPQVALIVKSMANEFFVTMAEGAKAHQASHSTTYQLILNGIKNESDLAQQVALIDQMIAVGVDAI